MRTWSQVIHFGASAAVSALAGRRVFNCLWELTYRCNARCRICPYWRRPPDTGQELTLQQIGEGLRRIHRGGCRFVNFTGGEPVLRRDLEEIIARSSQLGMWSSVVTNGTLLTRDRLRGLKAAGLDNLLVSLDSAGSDYHDAHRGIEGAHEKVLTLLDWIRSDFLGGHRTGGVMTAVCSGNVDEVPAIVALARRFGVYAVFQPYSDRKTGDGSRSPRIGQEQVDQLLDLHKTGTILNSRRYLSRWNPGARNRCAAGRKYFSIDPYGYLHPCVDLPAAGHILRDDLSVIRSNAVQSAVESCSGCWYCFRGEADTSLSFSGYVDKFAIGLGVIYRNLTGSRRRGFGLSPHAR